MRRALLPLLLLSLAGCPKPPAAAKPTYKGPPQAFKLIAEEAEAETASRKTKRDDLFVTTETGDPIPSVVSTNQVGPIKRQGARVRLYGDEGGKEGWSVDNFLLLEVLDANNTVINRIAVGFQQGVTMGKDQIETAGQMKFAFEPGEVDISRFLPEHEPFSIRATALDTGGIGRVSNVFLVISADDGSGDPGEIREGI